MTSRNLTEVFVIMRNNAQHNRNMYDDDRVSDRVVFLCYFSSLPMFTQNNHFLLGETRVVTVKNSWSAHYTKLKKVLSWEMIVAHHLFGWISWKKLNIRYRSEFSSVNIFFFLVNRWVIRSKIEIFFRNFMVESNRNWTNWDRCMPDIYWDRLSMTDAKKRNWSKNWAKRFRN